MILYIYSSYLKQKKEQVQREKVLYFLFSKEKKSIFPSMGTIASAS